MFRVPLLFILLVVPTVTLRIGLGNPDQAKVEELTERVTLEKLDELASSGVDEIRFKTQWGQDKGEVGSLVDDFLTPRFAWWIVKEPELEGENDWILKRRPAHIAPMLDLLSLAQFPTLTGNTCTVNLYVEGSQMCAHHLLASNFREWLNSDEPHPIKPVWEGGADFLHGFCDEESPLHNKLEDCYYLPMTNCPLSEQEYVRLTKDKLSSDPFENPLELRMPESQSPRAMNFKQTKPMQFKASQSANASRAQLRAAMRAMIAPENNAVNQLGEELATVFMMVHNRPNFRLRQAMAAKKREFAEKNPAWLDDARDDGKSKQCLSLHMRQGDKLQQTWIEGEGREGKFDGFFRSVDEILDEGLDLIKDQGGDPSQKPNVLVMSDDQNIIDGVLASDRVHGMTLDMTTPLGKWTDKGADDQTEDEFNRPDAPNKVWSGDHRGNLSPDDFIEFHVFGDLMAECEAFEFHAGSTFALWLWNQACATRVNNHKTCMVTRNLGNIQDLPNMKRQLGGSVSLTHVIQQGEVR